MSNSSFASFRPVSMPARVPTVDSRDFFSRPSSWARFWSFQMPGSANSFSTSARRFCLPARSKIPPQLFRPLLQAGERRGELVEAFGFHRVADYTFPVRRAEE